ncbi:hypothetical protein Cri9333_4523 [Crinalium epipsammum PCC 9333]|uniref:Uncharacterized protein n=1 Tax=Crinalium epipsammum PCC 9333 TaxID=1173022 RepID=K9W676_9CYAN|nr:hypothetical protein [Crinalium epipsammum]AFZ15304.1 hypothetical protein Cri9333_4523 [Crinalium epipsammum PCC 9333]
MTRRNEFLGVVLGILGVLGINLLVFILLLFYTINNYPIESTPPAFLFGSCLYQLLYVIPAIIWLKREQRWGLMKGIIIGAVITALLNGGCFLMLVPPR